MKTKNDWIPIEESRPEPQQKVYVVCEEIGYDGKVYRFQTIAIYIPPLTIREEDFMAEDYWGGGVYVEEDDEYYASEGFYEWQSETDSHWKLTAKVTHWLPLIEFPSKSRTDKTEGKLSEDELIEKLLEAGWIEDRDMPGRYISPDTKITYTMKDAFRIENLIK